MRMSRLGLQLVIGLDVQTERSLKLVTHFGPGHALLLEHRRIQVELELTLRDVRLDVGDVDRRCDLDGGQSELLGLPFLHSVLWREANRHGRCLWHLPRIDDLDDARKTLCHVHCRHTSVVEGPHRHLRPRFTDGLSGDDAGRLVGVHASEVDGVHGFLNDRLCLGLLELPEPTGMAGLGQVDEDALVESSTCVLGCAGEAEVDLIILEPMLVAPHLPVVVVGFEIEWGSLPRTGGPACTDHLHLDAPSEDSTVAGRRFLPSLSFATMSSAVLESVSQI